LYAVQDVALPPMDAMNEGDVVCVVLECGKEFKNTKDFKMDWIPNKADMGSRVDQTLSAVMAFTVKSGKYSVCIVQYLFRLDIDSSNVYRV
jgi:hypothetical protein